jgi:hypothetical protein
LALAGVVIVHATTRAATSIDPCEKADFMVAISFKVRNEHVTTAGTTSYSSGLSVYRDVWLLRTSADPGSEKVKQDQLFQFMRAAGSADKLCLRASNDRNSRPIWHAGFKVGGSIVLR